MSKFALDVVTPVGMSFKGCKKITDTAGFEPLECKIKRFILGGMVNRFTSKMFDSDDYQQMLESVPSIVSEMDDDLEDVAEKVRQVRKVQAAILASKKAAAVSTVSTEASSETESKPTVGTVVTDTVSSNGTVTD